MRQSRDHTDARRRTGGRRRQPNLDRAHARGRATVRPDTEGHRRPASIARAGQPRGSAESPMTAVDPGLPELARRHPEWKPWLAVIEEILREAADPRWDALVPTHMDRPNGKAPLLAGAPLVVDQ